MVNHLAEPCMDTPINDVLSLRFVVAESAFADSLDEYQNQTEDEGME